MNVNNLNKFCTAQRDFEGKPGDLNYKNNNPGNFRCSPVGYLPKYGNVQCVNNFAHFPAYELGWMYLENSVVHTATIHPDWTIQEYVYHYAPPSDGNLGDVSYAQHLADSCGVSPETTLGTLFT